MPVGEFAIMLLREEKKGRTWDSTVRWELMVNKQRAKGFRTFLLDKPVGNLNPLSTVVNPF